MSGTLARLSGNKDQALQDALGHLAPDARTATALPGADPAPGTHVQVSGDKVVTAVRHIPAQAARYAPWPADVDARLIEALAARGIEQPYTHQAEAIGHALAGRHVVVVTPTASGKTLCYNGAVLSTVLREPGARALYLFPTKALAQDQLAELQGLAQIVGAAAQREIGVFTYDGDTPVRRAARDQGARQRRAQQPRHAACRRPAAPSALGAPVREPPLHRHRRTARVSRRVRQPPGQRPAPAAAHLPALRVESDVHLHVGDDRQSEGAGRAADRAAVRARRREWRPARREVLRAAEPAGGQPGARHPPLVPRRRRGASRSSSCAGTCS